MSQYTCNYQLVFSPSLDHAATCARFGANVLLAQRQPDERAVRIKWIHAAHDEPLAQTAGNALADD